jgi:hypothetical protein
MVSHAILELLLAAGGLDMLNAHVKALVDDAALDLLVHKNANSGLGDVPHTASTAVIVPVRHTLVDGTVDLDVNEVTNLVLSQVSLHGRKTMVAEPLREHVTRITAHAPGSAAPHLDLNIPTTDTAQKTYTHTNADTVSCSKPKLFFNPPSSEYSTQTPGSTHSLKMRLTSTAASHNRA